MSTLSIKTMVKVEEKDRSFWTLPGGGVEKGEKREETAVREALEEINLKIKIIRFLFARQYTAGTEYCYLAEPQTGEQHLKTGHDPELPANEQVLKHAEWIQISDLKDDFTFLQGDRGLKPRGNSEIQYQFIRRKPRGDRRRGGRH